MKNKLIYPWLLRASIIISLLIFDGCIEEKISIPTTGVVTMQLHGLNGAMDGFDPDILYFKQKDDGSYLFTMSGKTSWGSDAPMTHDWSTKYVSVSMDQDGAIISSQELDYPFANGVFGYFDQLFSAGDHPKGGYEIPRLHSSENNGLSYSVERLGNIVTFNLDPETGAATGFTSDVIEPAYSGTAKGTFRTSDGGYITITERINENVNPPDHFLTYAKFSNGGSLEFRHDYPIVDNDTYSDLALEKDGEYYFVNVNTGIVSEEYTIDYDNTEATKLESYLTATSLPSVTSDNNCFAVPQFLVSANGAVFEAAIRFGPGKAQKAHRFFNKAQFTCDFPSVGGLYQDYVDVPFEVWDITNNRKLMAGFVDRGEDGVFNLVNRNFCSCWSGQCSSANCCFTSSQERFPCDCNPPLPGAYCICADCGQNFGRATEIPATTESKEFLLIYDFLYSEIPSAAIESTVRSYALLPILTKGATWDPDKLPVSSLVIRPPVDNPPATKLIKVNATGITEEINQDFLKALVTVGLSSEERIIKNIYKAVPFGDGFAILADVSRLYKEDEIQPSLLFLFDSNFLLKGTPEISEHAADNEQLESNGNAILYSAISNNKLRLVVINSVGNKTSLDVGEDLTSFPIEGYKTTPTNTGGWAVLVWAKPTASTRDLLFLEFDANLNLVKR